VTSSASERMLAGLVPHSTKADATLAGASCVTELMNGMALHIVFDAIAWVAAELSLLLLTKWTGVRFAPAPISDIHYIAALIFGAGVGAVVFGTANAWLSHQTSMARSIEGAIAGAIMAVELYKRAAGIKGRTGARFALPLAVGVAVGRIGCFFAGLEDLTHGKPTELPWAHDFGDGIMRHPVQLYESGRHGRVRAHLHLARTPQRPLCDRQRLLSRGRFLRRAALRLGISSNPTARWSVRSRCFISCRPPSSPMPW
jgi:Prolipoprotein diacylglyceryl transferase